MRKITLSILTLAALGFTACENDDNTLEPIDNAVVAPVTYTFERESASTVDFSGQTTRIQMGEELISAMLDFDNATTESLSNMFSNEDNPFQNDDLNASSKSIKSKVAASEDYFVNSPAASAQIKAQFESFITAQVNEVFPAQMNTAQVGIAGQIADETSTRYVNGIGLEYNQALGKGLIGALMVDQALNNYLSIAVLDEATNREDNDNDVLAEGKTYTTMEHKWDEAYGYVYGNSQDATNPNLTIGQDDSFLNKYIGRVQGDGDFDTIAAEIFNAFKLGRAAIVAKNYDVRDQQASIIRSKISQVVGVRAVYYLQQGKNAIEAGNMGTAFHDLSEGYGFIYSLQFTRNPETDAPYFSAQEVGTFIGQLTQDNGFWEVTAETLDELSATIAARFDFTVEQAASTN